MKEKQLELIDQVFENAHKSKVLKVVVGLVVAGVAVYALGKMFSICAGSIRGFNDFRLAIKGN